MKWNKKGLIYKADSENSWQNNSALQPTPLLIDNEIIRIFCGFRDQIGVSRVGYVDVLAKDPSVIVQVAEFPALDIGLPGTFDDNGVVPCAVVKREGKIFLYYAGYQLMQKVRFQVFSGLAISEDEGKNFVRYQNVPLLERTHNEFLFRVIHSIFFENGVWKTWYGAGKYFIPSSKKTLPVYNIRYMESKDGIHFPSAGSMVIDTASDEFRVGRPYVIKSNDCYQMFFGASTENSIYRLAYAESLDGKKWQRNDAKLNLAYVPNHFDSEMSSYPSVIKFKDKTYLFYNGNNYGYAGFGYAELIET